MSEDTRYLIFITLFFVALPIAADVFALWRLNHASADYAPTQTRTVVGYLGLAANFFAIAIVWGTVYCNVWLSNHGSGVVVGGVRSYQIALILALSSLIFGVMAPRGIRLLLVFTSLYVGFTLILVSAGAGVL